MKDADRELVELAAMAYGLQVKGWIGNKLKYFDPVSGFGDWDQQWNPLESDGDAFRLMSALRLEIRFADGFKQLWCRRDCDSDNLEMHGLVGYGNGTDKEPTIGNVRRAITLAAAEIGRGMG